MARVQSASVSTDGSAPVGTIAKAFAAPVTAGNRLLAFVNWGASTGSVTKIDDTVNGSGVWTRIAASNGKDGTGPQQGEVWELRSTLAGTPTVTATFDLTTYGFRGIIIVEVAGCDPAVAANAATGNGMTSNTAFTTANITPTIAGCYLAAFCTNGTDSQQPIVGSGYVLRETPGGATQITGFEDRVQAAAAPIAGTFSFTTAVTGTVHLVALAPLALGGGLMPQRMTGTVPNDARYRAQRTMQAYSSDLVTVVIPSTIVFRRTLDLGNASGVGSRRAIH